MKRLSLQDQLNTLWRSLLEHYPDGVSNTSTTKYNDIRKLLSTILDVPEDHIYATGAKTRTSNLDTRFVQGNQAGRHTKIGVAFMQVKDETADIEKMSDSAVVTSRKFVDGSDNTLYDAILILFEISEGLKLTRVIQSSTNDYFSILQPYFPDAKLVSITKTNQITTSPLLNATDLPIENVGVIFSANYFSDMVKKFNADAKLAKLRVNLEVEHRLLASLLSKRFLIITGLSGSGKTKIAHAFASWFTPVTCEKDPFEPGSKIGKTYTITSADHISVEFSNNENQDEGKLITLPRGIIKEWADFICKNNIDNDTPSQQIRDAVKQSSKYGKQLHSFDTHLKPAAFALLDSRNIQIEVSNYRIVSVGADWTSNENTLGYQDALQPAIYRKPASGALDLILQAEKDPARPYFLILDEMNLSHVERYFADILSAIESEQEIALHSATELLGAFENDPLPVPAKIRLPENLFIIGTVNIDETTYMFSPKVLDRANVIEFRVSEDEISSFLDSPAKVNMDFLAGKGAGYGSAFVNAARMEVSLAQLPAGIGDGGAATAELKQRLTELFAELAPIGAEFGFRTAFEVSRFFYHHAVLTGEGWKFKDALDAQIVQKLMPKLHGSDRKLRPTLTKLQTFCETHDLQLSLAKTKRMLERLTQDGFTSFAEA